MKHLLIKKLDRNFEQLAECMRALGHPMRLQIVKGLINNECNVTQIQKNLMIPQSTISQHLKILKNAGIIESRREGTMVCYKVLNHWVKNLVTDKQQKE
ncbi:MAG: winged helix-turn-helix transcriptional regulator [Bacteroidales bacterium]|nr:winged helix-turn-helix transcriptional regulator [Bacteroidales bacterium]